MEPKTIAIISYLTIIGWIVALVMNSNQKSEFASFHIRQFLGIFLTAFAAGIVMIVPIIGWIAGFAGYIFALVMWVMGFIGAVQGQQKLVPVLGDRFQEWFKSL